MLNANVRVIKHDTGGPRKDLSPHCGDEVNVDGQEKFPRGSD